jgi:hypothetical protein
MTLTDPKDGTVHPYTRAATGNLLYAVWKLLEQVRCVSGTIADLSANVSATEELPARLAFLERQWTHVLVARNEVRSALSCLEVAEEHERDCL